MERAGKETIHCAAPDEGPRPYVEALARALRSGARPDGIVTVGTSATIGALRALTDAGLRVPHDCRLVALDGDSALDCLVPSVSSVDAPLADLAVDAAENLLLTLRPKSGGMIGPRVRKGTLVARESSA